MYGYVYITTNDINGKKYIGKHRSDTADDDYIGSGTVLRRAIKKHGVQHFTKEVLYIADSDLDLSAKEIEIITEHNAVDRPDYYNIARGGAGGDTYSGKPRDEVEIATAKRLATLGPEERRANALRRWSLVTLQQRTEHGRKMSALLKGKPKSENHKKNLSESKTGRPRVWKSPDGRDAYSARRKAEVAAGINVPPKGNAGNKEFRHTEESKQLMRQKAAEAHERIMAERGSYHTPEGIASKRAKMDDWLTPERRERFREETKEALKLAKRNQKAYADAFAQQHLPMIQSMLADGFNLLQIAEKMNADGHRTRQDAVWTDQTVRQILKRVGRKSPVSRLERAERERKQRADDFAHSLYAIIGPMRQAGLNLSEIAARLNAEGHRTRRGSEWTYQLVGNVIRRMEAYVPKSRGIGSELLLGGLTSSTKPGYGATRVIGWDRI